MAALTKEHMQEFRGAPVVDRDGDKVGTVEQVYLNVSTNEPQWIALRTGTIGGRTSFAPLDDAMVEGNTIRLPVEKGHIESSPEVYPDAISTYSEQALRQHYGLTEPTPMAGQGQNDYAMPAQPQSEPLRERLRRYEWESRQR